MMSQGASSSPMEGEESPEDEREVTFVAEKDEVDALVASIAELERNADPVAFQKVTQIVLRYQELPQLLDPHLEGWITPLAGVLRAEAHKGDDADITSFISFVSSRLISSRSSIVMVHSVEVRSPSLACAAQVSTYPFDAANSRVPLSHGQPFSRAHFSTSRWPPPAA